MKGQKRAVFWRTFLRDTLFLVIVLAVAVVLLGFFPEKRVVVTRVSWKFFVELILILPAVMVLMGLFPSLSLGRQWSSIWEKRQA